MMLEHLFNSSFLYSLSLTLLHFLWQGMLVALVLKSALLIFSDKKPQLRYALSALAMLTNLLLPIITFGIIYRTELAFASANASAYSLTSLMQELQQPDSFFSYQGLSELLPSFLPYIALLWLATITLLAGKLLIEIYSVNKLPQQGSIEPNPQLLARFNELAKQINLTNTPKLLISLKVDVPMAIGWLKPVVLIPATMISGLNSAQLEMLILHELAHIRRHDYLVNFLQTFVEILLFFHPAVLWVSKQMRNEREYCSDDIAVQHCGDAIAYAHTLADTASLCTKANHHHTIPSMAMAASGGDLKQRVIRLVDHHCAPQNNISKWFASATIIFSVLLLSSKQLLTMPLLDLWHNETPFKANNNASTEDASQANILLNSELPTSSIAKQLLIPNPVVHEKTSPNESTVEPAQMATNEADTQQMIAKSLGTVLPTFSKVSKQALTANDDAEFSAKLDDLSTTERLQTNTFIESTQSHIVATSTNSMVEQAFEKTDSGNQHSVSNNPYAQELAHLASSVSNTEHNSTLATIERKKTTSITAKQLTAMYKESSPSVIKPTQSAELFITDQDDFAIATKNVEQGLVQEPIWHNAKQLKSVDPVYPSVAKRKGIEIEVKVNFTIDVNGQIKDIQFARQNKINYFKNSIRSAIEQWRFLPAKVDDQPVESQMSKVFAFSLQS